MTEHLADPYRCPSCASPLTPARDVCPACGVRLTGPTAGRLWQVSVQAAQLLDHRQELIQTLRLEAATAAAQRSGPAGVTSTTPVAGPLGSEPAGPAQVAGPRPEWSKRRVQNLLLALGVGLLGVAAVIFVAVSWDRLGVGGRSAIMAGITGVAALAGIRTNRRGLTSTAEWLSLLTVGMAVLDAYGARASDLAGLAGSDGALYWAGALTVVAAGAAALAVPLPATALKVAAAVVAQLPVPLLCGYLVDEVDRPVGLVATATAAQAVAALALAAAWPAGAGRAARRVVAAGGGVAFVVAAVSAAGAAYGEDGSLVVGTALLLLLAAALTIGSTWLGDRAPASPLALPVVDGVTALLVVAAVWAPVVDAVADRWLAPALSGAALALLAMAALLPAARRVAPTAVALAAAVYPSLAAAEVLGAAVEGMVEPLGEAWTSTAAAVPVVADGPAASVLAVVAAALVLGGVLLRQRLVTAAAVPVGVASAALAAPAVGVEYAGSLAALVALGAALLAGGALLERAGQPLAGRTALAVAVPVLGLAVSWSLAVDRATLVVLPVAAAAALAGAAAARGLVALRAWRVALVAAALLVAVAEAAAVARYEGAGWPAVWALALSLLVLTSVLVSLGLALRTAAGDGFWAPLHTTPVAVATAAGVADAAAVAAWRGVSLAGCGLAAAVAAALLLALSALPVPTARPVRGVVQVVAGAGALPALTVAAPDGRRFWVALLVVGVGVALVATTPGRHRLGWVAGVVLAASSWVRLALADVDAPEAYTVPGALALLVVGAVRRHRDPGYGSWPAYGAGLSLALVPSLLRAVTDAGDVRPLLLAVVAAGVVAAGVARRLQAPLLLGGVVLAVDAVVQLAPYLAAAYESVPRWVTIGTLGLLLLGAGATYEQRVRDLQRVGRGVGRLT